MSDYDDLYGAFTLLEERAPTTCDVPPRAQDARRRLRHLMPLAAVAAVATVAVAVPLIATSVGHDKSASGPPAKLPANCYLTVEPLTLPWGIIAPDPTQLPVACGQVTRYEPGAFDPSSVDGAKPITVAGKDGVYGTLPALATGSAARTGRTVLPSAGASATATPDAGPVPSVAWQLGSGRWAVAQGTKPDLQTQRMEIAIATAVDSRLTLSGAAVNPPGLSKDMPYWLGYIPQAAHEEWGCGRADDSKVSLGGWDFVSVVTYQSHDHRTSLTTQIYGPGASPDPAPQPPSGSVPIQVQGHTVYVGTHTIDATVGAYSIRITYAGPAVTHGELLRTAQGLRFPADIANRATWFNCSDT